jgi:hypothetical protein
VAHDVQEVALVHAVHWAGQAATQVPFWQVWVAVQQVKALKCAGFDTPGPRVWATVGVQPALFPEDGYHHASRVPITMPAPIAGMISAVVPAIAIRDAEHHAEHGHR